MFKQLEVPILGVVENMSYPDLLNGIRMDLFGAGGGNDGEQRVADQYHWVIGD
jgi:ATP-binding protein involved in chromosome partitioning